jgi:hypothetical protein
MLNNNVSGIISAALKIKIKLYFWAKWFGKIKM